jgi:hypothetical protein
VVVVEQVMVVAVVLVLEVFGLELLFELHQEQLTLLQ